MGHTWKTREETFHGSKWGYVVVVLVIAIVLSLLGAIFYLIGEGIKEFDLSDQAIFTYSVGGVIGLITILIIVGLLVKIGVIAVAGFTGALMMVHKFLAVIWAMFNNIYLLVLAVILTVVLLLALSAAVYTDMPVSFSNPVVIGILIVLFIIFVPFAIFIIDLFSYEHE